jgi:short-subunit dehydrogenase
MANAADATEKAFGKVHVLVNNAGIGIGGPVREAKYADWDWGLDVNLGGVINGIQEFLPRLIAHGEGGHIINTSSMAAVVPMRMASIYITAKAAVLGLSEELRGELEPDNIGVSAFCPGPVQTNIAHSGELRPDKYRANSGYAKFEQQLKERPNSPLWMHPDEVGERVLKGLRRNDLFIFTHREFKKGLTQRCRKMLASFPDEEINKARYKEIKWLTENASFRTDGNGACCVRWHRQPGGLWRNGSAVQFPPQAAEADAVEKVPDLFSASPAMRALNASPEEL